jgi:hypothetical protein
MPNKVVRAVVRGIDTAPKRTEWLPSGSPDLLALLLAVLPPVGENFSVVWETRETQGQAA